MKTPASDPAPLTADEVGAFDWGAYFLMAEAINTLGLLAESTLTRPERNLATAQLRTAILRLSSISQTLVQDLPVHSVVQPRSKSAILERFNNCIESINQVRSKLLCKPLPILSQD